MMFCYYDKSILFNSMKCFSFGTHQLSMWNPELARFGTLSFKSGTLWDSVPGIRPILVGSFHITIVPNLLHFTIAC